VAFTDAASFVEAVGRVERERGAMARAGRRYAARFGWGRVVDAYREEMDAMVKAR
jgi:glycosyltransferase involved in cell wall biosynthesis